MSLTIVITRDVEQRYRGFLGSLMLEVAPGVYVNPRLSRPTRERVEAVLTAWHCALQRGSVTLIWREADKPGGLGIKTLGEAPKDIHDVDGFLLMRREISAEVPEHLKHT